MTNTPKKMYLELITLMNGIKWYLSQEKINQVAFLSSLIIA